MVRVGVLVPFGVFVPTRVVVRVAVSIAALVIVVAPVTTTAPARTGRGDNATARSSTGTVRAIASVTRSAYYDSVSGRKRAKRPRLFSSLTFVSCTRRGETLKCSAPWCTRAAPMTAAPVRWLRAVSATVGTAAWVYWWLASARMSPRASMLLWLAALLPWALALFSTWKPRRPGLTTVWAALVIAALSLPRTLSLADAPYKVTPDEVCYSFSGLAMFAEHPWEIFAGADDGPYGHLNYLTEALQTWPALFFEPLLGARLASALLGIVSLALTYFLACRLFGRAAGAVAVTVIACSFWHMVFSHIAYQYMLPVALVAGALLALVVGTEERNRFLQFISGALEGMSLLAYDPARIVILLAASWFAHSAVVSGAGWRETAKGAAVITLGAVIFLSPFHQRQGVLSALARYRLVSAQVEGGPVRRMNEAGWTTPAAREILANQINRAARVYYSQGAELRVNDISSDPLVDPVSLALALCGLVLAVVYLRDSNRFLLVVWVGATFVLGQVLTNLPHSSYRAAPICPALAICAGLAGAAFNDLVLPRLRARQLAAQTVALIVLLAVLAPLNLRYLGNYFAQRSRDPVVGMDRLIAAGSTAPVYYVVETGQQHACFRFLTTGRTVRELPSLMDDLGAIDTTRDAVFVFDPAMAEAGAQIVRRCYPGAVTVSGPYPAGPQPVVALAVSQEALAAAGSCGAPTDGVGLLARYFSGADWDGTVTRERIEDWPLRWVTPEEAEQFRSVEWSGFLRIPASGFYMFELITGNAAGDVAVGSQVLLEHQGSTRASLDAGEYPLRFRCQPGVFGSCWLRWAPPGGVFESIPRQYLRPAGNGSPNVVESRARGSKWDTLTTGP
jgi:hypothetical protein